MTNSVDGVKVDHHTLSHASAYGDSQHNHQKMTTQRFRMETVSYIENLLKLQNCQNWWVGACTEMGACLGQKGNSPDDQQQRKGSQISF